MQSNLIVPYFIAHLHFFNTHTEEKETFYRIQE